MQKQIFGYNNYKLNLENFNYIEHYKLDAEAFDYSEEKAGATGHDHRRVHEFISANVSNNIKSILDVGCGSAWVAQNFLNKGKTIYSLDISSTNPKKALENYPSKNHSGITADSFLLPFKENSFDCIIASEIIEHVVYPDKFVAELFRVVKPGGNLLISTPYKEKITYYLCIHCNKLTPLHSHIHSFDEKKLQSLYKGKDLEDFEWKIFGSKVLIFSRSYVILKYLPFFLWRMIDSLVNLLYSAPAHIMVMYKKKGLPV